MPLIRSKSKKAMTKNIEREMNTGKPQNQALAVAYSMKRKNEHKNKKMAEGGKVDEAKGKHADNHSYNYDDSQSVKGVNKVLPHYNRKSNNMEYGGSESSWGGKNKPETMRRMHAETLKDLKDMPAPKLKGLAEGGEVKRKGMQVTAIKHPKMVPSDSFSVRLRDQEDDLQDLHPSENEGMSMADHDDEEGQDRQGPSIHDMEEAHYMESEPYQDAEENEDDEQDINPASLAEGGSVEHEMGEQPDEEAEMEHHASVAAAIMAKREARQAMDSGSEDEDEAEMYAEGGEVDLSESHDEEPNNEDQYSFDALKKENYNDSDLDMDQPEDSNLHGDEEESDSEDDHDRDVVSHIRRSMRKRSPITR